MSNAIRWVARGLSVVLVLFFAFMVSAHFLGGQEAPPGTATTLAIGVILLGLIVAWKWEALGGIVVLCGYAFSALLAPPVLRAWPYAVCLLAGVLFLISWFMRRPANTKA